MKSQTALVARSCRLNEWIQMIHDCKNRPAGMSVDEWCKLNSREHPKVCVNLQTGVR